jgi:hypothetical protein
MNREKSEYQNSHVSGLLHNMSCAPRSQIQYRSPHRRKHWRGIVFALRAGQNVIAGLIGKNPDGLALEPSGDAECELRRRIDAHARTLPLPAAALVTPSAEPGDEECNNLLSIVTVLAKSSGHVYLRDKAPNLDRVQPGQRVVLLVPKERRAR